MKKDQMKKRMVEKEVDSSGGEKRCRRSDSPVASVQLPASEKESSGLGQQNVWTKGSADRDNIRQNQSTEEEEISKYCAWDVSVGILLIFFSNYQYHNRSRVFCQIWRRYFSGIRAEYGKSNRFNKNGQVEGGKLIIMVWKFYYVSTEKNAVTRRARAKCKFCHFELDGRPGRMLSHSEKWKEILPHDRHQVYTMLASKQKFTLEQDS
uniref:AlNc14C722G12445 protein n=1 Tax=Albugo laibachii Nc14 TaxID=890382 RepID=F0X1W8_9STRA|nr:AlNc14C722G12445 [Albugo laibachii Nc14]|eukprot:CCA27825.1 AlNc14C722G12445 [Albugo laibachii Nc14]